MMQSYRAKELEERTGTANRSFHSTLDLLYAEGTTWTKPGCSSAGKEQDMASSSISKQRGVCLEVMKDCF